MKRKYFFFVLRLIVLPSSELDEYLIMVLLAFYTQKVLVTTYLTI